MMGGPIDARKAPTEVNTVATQRPHAWFKSNVIATVPYLYPGAGRKVYPGFLQLAGFMAMNFGNHLVSHWGMFRHLVEGDGEGAEATKDFYDEYRAVCDMTEEFYLQTIDVVFQRHLLPKGELTHRGRRVDPAAIRDIATARHRGRARRHQRRRPDQGRARHLDRPAQEAETLPPRQDGRPLRHLQRQQMAQRHRAGGRGMDRAARLSRRRMSGQIAGLFKQPGKALRVRGQQRIHDGHPFDRQAVLHILRQKYRGAH